MPLSESWKLMLEKIQIVQDESEEAMLIGRLAESTSSQVVSFVNAHAANMICKNWQFRNDISDSDIVLRDGAGMHILYSALCIDSGRNMNGTDFIPNLLKLWDKSQVVSIYGTEDPYLSEGGKKIESLGFRSVLTEHGFHDLEYYVQAFNRDLPGIVILAMGMPKQEKLSLMIHGAANFSGNKVVIINGGAVIDFMARRFNRAPSWVRKGGLEWLYRLLYEPTRLWRRNAENITFLFRVLVYRLRSNV